MTILERKPLLLPEENIHHEIHDELNANFSLPNVHEKRELILLKSSLPKITLFDTLNLSVNYPFFMDEVKKTVDVELYISDDEYHYDFVGVNKNRDKVKALIFVLEDPKPKNGYKEWKDTPEHRIECLHHYGLEPLSLPEICTLAMVSYNPFPVLCYGAEKSIGCTTREITITKNKGFSSFFRERNTIHGVSFGCSSIYKPVKSIGKPIMYVAKEVRKKYKR